MISLLSIDLGRDAHPTELERVRRNHHDAIAELQRLPFAGARVVRDVTLADGVVTPVSHGLGRSAVVLVSPVRNAAANGRIEEVRDGTHDRTKYAAIKATGYGATVTVDVVFL